MIRPSLIAIAATLGWARSIVTIWPPVRIRSAAGCPGPHPAVSRRRNGNRRRRGSVTGIGGEGQVVTIGVLIQRHDHAPPSFRRGEAEAPRLGQSSVDQTDVLQMEPQSDRTRSGGRVVRWSIPAGLMEGQAQIAGFELDLVPALGAYRESEHIPIEANRPVEVRDEQDDVAQFYHFCRSFRPATWAV